MHIVYGTTIAGSARSFLVGQMLFQTRLGWEVELVTSPGDDLDRLLKDLSAEPSIAVHLIPMSRQPHLWSDLKALGKWVALLKRTRPDIVVVGTPKAGLLGILAARIVGIQCRIYVLHGLRLETLSGVMKRISALTERLAFWACTQVICVSPSLQRVVEQAQLSKREKLYTVMGGSAAGVDVNYFRPRSMRERNTFRESFDLAPDAQVVGFAGRLVSDKGVRVLLDAFSEVVRSVPRAVLLLAGRFEGPTDALLKPHAEIAERVYFLGELEDMRTFYGALDVFCLPSFREGMPTVNLEASACGIPVVTTNATGCIDSVINNVTGRIVPTGDADSLAQAVVLLLRDPEERQRLGLQGRHRVIQEFSQQEVWALQTLFLRNFHNHQVRRKTDDFQW